MNSNNDAVIEFLLNQLRQQLTNNPYKQQCEDLAHEVLSLKNQLRDASALVAELQRELALVAGDASEYIAAEQSGCRKEDAQESYWIEWFGGYCPVPRGTLVDVTYRDGKTLNCLPADEIHCTSRDASSSFWQHHNEPNDIVRYRRTTHQ